MMHIYDPAVSEVIIPPLVAELNGTRDRYSDPLITVLIDEWTGDGVKPGLLIMQRDVARSFGADLIRAAGGGRGWIRLTRDLS